MPIGDREGTHRMGELNKAEAMAAEAPPRGEAPRGPDRFTTDELFHGTNEIVISHRDAVYRLKITRQGKLVLNK